MKTLRESLLDIDSVQSGLEPIKIIDGWCKENIKGTYKIDPKTLDINSNGNIEITNKELIEFPDYIHFGTVGGYFKCRGCNNLTSLKGAPKKVHRDFSCAYCNSLTSLEGAPKEVGGYFYCHYCNNLTSLEGAPKEVGGDFNCACCDSLQSLEGAPKKVHRDFSCACCDSLQSLEGAPKEVGGYFYCGFCKKQFTKDEVKKVCKVKGDIIV